MSRCTIPIKSDFAVTLTGVKAESGSLKGQFLNAGTAAYALKSAAGTQLDTGAMPYVADSDGDYEGVIDAVVTGGLTEGEVYYVEVTFSQSDYDAFHRVPYTAGYLGGS